jgi:hypothetical protein
LSSSKSPVPKEERSEVQKLDAVWKDLIESVRVGTIDEPKQYFHGKCLMRYLAFRDSEPPVLWLTGETENTILGLGGALSHVRWSGEAAAPADAEFGLFEAPVAKTIAETLRSKRMRLPDGLQIRAEGRSDWTSHVEEILLYAPSENQIECEFLAEKEKFEQRSPGNGKSVLLGSPLFVSYRFTE